MQTSRVSRQLTKAAMVTSQAFVPQQTLQSKRSFVSSLLNALDALACGEWVISGSGQFRFANIKPRFKQVGVVYHASSSQASWFLMTHSALREKKLHDWFRLDVSACQKQCEVNRTVAQVGWLTCATTRALHFITLRPVSILHDVGSPQYKHHGDSSDLIAK